MNRQEIWMSVRDYVGLYEVSNWGRVRSLGLDKYHHGRVLKPHKVNGYDTPAGKPTISMVG